MSAAQPRCSLYISNKFFLKENFPLVKSHCFSLFTFLSTEKPSEFLVKTNMHSEIFLRETIQKKLKIKVKDFALVAFKTAPN
jgi:hypothetical protein